MVSENGQSVRDCDPAEHAQALKEQIPVGLSPAIDRAARLFRALGDTPRLRLAARLLVGECCVGELAAAEGEAISTISQRLRVLYTENIVVRRRRGKHVNYALTDAHVAELVRNALDHAGEASALLTWGKTQKETVEGTKRDE